MVNLNNKPSNEVTLELHLPREQLHNLYLTRFPLEKLIDIFRTCAASVTLLNPKVVLNIDTTFEFGYLDHCLIFKVRFKWDLRRKLSWS